MDKNSFILYIHQKELFNALNDTQAGKLIKAIFQYEETGEIPNLNSNTNIAFISIRTALDNNKEKYEKVVKRNRENGKKGGRPKTQNIPNNPVGILETQGKTQKPKKADNDIDNESDNESDNDVDDILKDLVKYYEDNMGLLVPSTATIFIDMRNSYSEDLIKKGIDICCKRNIRTMSYLDGILKDWERKGYKTVADIREEKKGETDNGQHSKYSGIDLSKNLYKGTGEEIDDTGLI